MPRTMKEIIDHADELARRFEEYEPDPAQVRDAHALAKLRELVLARSAVERDLAAAVAAAREEGHSWGIIGAMLGTSGEAARQRYGRSVGTT
jgi:hypothetical protein